MAAQFKNAPFLSDLLTVLNHPVTAGTPDLKHFRLDAATVAGQRAQAIQAIQARRSEQGGRSLFVAALLAGWLMTAAALAALWWFRQSLPAWARRGALLVIPVALVALSYGLQVKAAAHRPQAPAALPSLAAIASPTASPSSPALPAASTPAWQELVAVENELAHTQDTLTTQESQIRHLASNPAALPTAAPPTAGSPLPASPGGGPATATSPGQDGLDTPAQRRVAQLIDSYEQAAARYQEALKREYDIYRAAAQDPARKQQLIAAAASTPGAGVNDAVTYNLALVQAQVDQENAINAAEAKLQAIGSLSGSQLSAIRHHQAFIIPVEAPISQGFGPTDFGLEPAVNFHGTFYPHFHTGIDIVGAENAAVHAAADGVVLLANSSNAGYGNYVVVAHPDGFVTLYGHLNAFSVKAGDVVHQGQILGLEGSTGMSTGPHVHFEVRHNGDWVDPMPYLTGKANP